MLMTLPLLATLSLAPGQAGGLTLTEPRLTHGQLGPARGGAKFLPGDTLFLAFDIEGISADADGKAAYSVATEVTDAGGKSVFRQPPQQSEAVLALGGSQLPAYARVAIGQQQAAGEYAVKVTITDLAGKKSQSLTQKFEVLPPDFGLVRLATSGDPQGEVPAGLPCPGESLWVSGAVVGFQRGGAAKQPNVTLELRVLDADGKPTLARPFGGTINKDVPANDTALPVQFHVGLNRPGKFTVEVKATDALAGKTVTQTFPLTVHSIK
jgi:hypothetical protein